MAVERDNIVISEEYMREIRGTLRGSREVVQFLKFIINYVPSRYSDYLENLYRRLFDLEVDLDEAIEFISRELKED